MYLKKLNKKLAKRFRTEYSFIDGDWYIKMNENGTPVKNIRGQVMYTCMDKKELQIALASQEFTRVEN